ncbi:MAG: leucyl/phenylalanyl-tRNA--protein transferase, partial [Candidatus Competibacteraceae bacterium]|nr:leucyl/phenylalanyl-tRNA--protein transferase [Candidatus Competibacteraceae bacterium]
YDDSQPFPNPERALVDPDGLLAVGGSLAPRRLLSAYRHGIFPWYSSGQPILWWSPNPRTVLFPHHITISRSLRKTLKKGLFSVTMDSAFDMVTLRCSEPRQHQPGTWITPEMRAAYSRLHRLGYAHSVETWHGRRLVGGLYGVAIGRVFYGESMFSLMSDASKIALVALCTQLQHWRFAFIDCQMHTEHLLRMGAEDVSRRVFLELLRRFCPLDSAVEKWRFDTGLPYAPEPELP